MRKLLGWTGFILLLAALGASAWWAWPILFPSLPQGWMSTLAKADAALLQNRPDLARTALKEAPTSLPVSGWLQWNKRVFAVANQTEAWAWAASSAQSAVLQYPGNPDLAACLVWALLQADQPQKALDTARKVLPGTKWASLLVQTEVEAAGWGTGDWRALRETLSVPSEASFPVYEQLARLSDEPRLRKNALLAGLATGHLEEARQHLAVLTPAQRDQPPFDRLQALMAYDQGDWSRAATLLKSLSRGRPDTLLILADVYLHLGDSTQAKLIYDQLLADASGPVSGALLVNRATLAIDEGNPALAIDLLGRSGDLESRAALDRARLLLLEARFHLGESLSVRRSLETLVRDGRESPLALDAELLLGRLFPDLSSIPRLSSLVHRHPEYAPLVERLAWLHLLAQDYASAHRVLDQHQAALASRGAEPPWWLLLQRAYLQASVDDWVGAASTLALVPNSWRDAPYYANASLVSQTRAQNIDPEERRPLLEDSLEKLTKALDLLAPSTEKAALQRRSLWLTRKGELETSLLPLQIPAQRGALRSAATEDFRQAVQLDPDNLRASFLLRQATVNQEKP